MKRHNNILLSAPNSKDIPQTLSIKTSKLPGRMGFGIAVPSPGEAIPYLQITQGLQINRIGDLNTFGFKTVIDLGTNEEIAKKHRAETEELGMHYINISVKGFIPTVRQVKYFTQVVVSFSSDNLLIYAPNSKLLGTMWAAHQINLGAPIDYAINQGKKLGMEVAQETILRNRHGL